MFNTWRMLNFQQIELLSNVQLRPIENATPAVATAALYEVV